jgi:uncharacterized protein
VTGEIRGQGRGYADEFVDNTHEAALTDSFFAVRNSAIQGLGGFAVRRIRKGTRIVEYRGERITPEEADRRYDDFNAQPHVLLFTVDKATVIDAGVDGNDARFINHSCEPNCITVIDRKRVYIEASREIAPGEELTYDYNLTQDEPPDEETKLRYACHCGAKKCRGTMLATGKKSKRQNRKQNAKTKRKG